MPGGNPNWKTGGADHKPPGGAGWGGPAKGAGASAFTAATQPSGDAKSAGHAGKAAMRAFFEEKRMAYAAALDEIALTDPDSQRRTNALNSIIDRLDGKATQAVSGPDDGPIENVLRIECDGLRLGTRFGSVTGHESNSEPTTSEPNDTPLA